MKKKGKFEKSIKKASKAIHRKFGSKFHAHTRTGDWSTPMGGFPS
jgi:hypothetical protein